MPGKCFLYGTKKGAIIEIDLLKFKPMKKFTLPFFILLVTMLSSCEVIGGIFKAGAVTGIVAVVVILVLILWLMSKFRSK